jgi:glycosyltransferase involved in cell wall biosynthesis
LITGFDYGGTEGRLANLVRNMDRKRFTSRVISMTAPGGLGAELLKEGFEVGALGLRSDASIFAGFRKLVSIVREWRPNVLHTWMYHANVFGLMASKWAGGPRIAWGIACSKLELSRLPIHTQAAASLCRRGSRFVDLIIANSEAGFWSHAADGYERGRMVVIPNGFDTERFKPDALARASVRRELGLDADTPLIGMMARMDPMKDHRNFLQAARLMLSKAPDVHFLLAGEKVDPGNPKLRARVEEHCPPSRIHLLGMRTDVPRLTAALDIACLSSCYGEGLPNVLGEAMSCEVPCVATDVGDSKYLLGETGIVVPPRRPQAMADAWLSLLSLGESGRRDLGRAARERICRLFSLEKMTRRHEECYERMVGGEIPASAPGGFHG